MMELEMPEPVEGFVVTLNKQGYMTSTVDYYMKEFIDFASIQVKPVVDVGAAYGIATIPALETGAKVVALDLDERHLEIIKKRTPKAFLPNLTIKKGAFPEGFDFENNSISAFLVARVLHFFSPERLIYTADKIFQWLDKGGKLFLTADSPYIGKTDEFLPIYEERISKNQEFAGYLEDVKKYAPERGKDLPDTMLLLDPYTLKAVFSRAGFIIEKCDFLPRPEYPADLRKDNRESVGLICRKL